MNRSGSTFLANLFSKSPQICVCPEADILVELFLENPEQIYLQDNFKRLRLARSKDIKFKSWRLTDKNLLTIPDGLTNFECFLSILSIYRKKIKPDASIIAFKAERLIHLFFNIQQLHMNSFVNIQWISIIRDPRAVYSSQKNTIISDTGDRLSTNPIKTAWMWQNYIKKIISYSHFKMFRMVYYEKLLVNTYEEMDLLMEYLQVNRFDYLTYSGDLFHRLPESRKSIHEYITDQPRKEMINKWTNDLNDREKDVIQLITQKEGISMGYYTSSIKFNLVSYIKIYIELTFINIKQIILKSLFKIQPLFKN